MYKMCLVFTMFLIENNTKRQSRRFGTAKINFVFFQATLDYRVDECDWDAGATDDRLIDYFLVERADRFVN